MYKVYSKDNSGKLTLIKSTSETSITFTVKSTKSNKYVVKTTYSKYDGCISSGVETTVNFNGIDSIIYSEVKKDSVTVHLNTPYTFNDVTVYENLIDVTNNANISYEVLDSTNSQVDKTTFTQTVGTYKIAYSISYKSFTDHQVVTVTVK